MDIKEFDNINVSYDKESDVLYISDGSPRPAVSRMIDDGIIVRLDPSTKVVVGFTIVDFISHFSKSTPQPIPVGARFSLLQAA